MDIVPLKRSIVKACGAIRRCILRIGSEDSGDRWESLEPQRARVIQQQLAIRKVKEQRAITGQPALSIDIGKLAVDVLKTRFQGAAWNAFSERLGAQQVQAQQRLYDLNVDYNTVT